MTEFVRSGKVSPIRMVICIDTNDRVSSGAITIKKTRKIILRWFKMNLSARCLRDPGNRHGGRMDVMLGQQALNNRPDVFSTYHPCFFPSWASAAVTAERIQSFSERERCLRAAFKSFCAAELLGIKLAISTSSATAMSESVCRRHFCRPCSTLVIDVRVNPINFASPSCVIAGFRRLRASRIRRPIS